MLESLFLSTDNDDEFDDDEVAADADSLMEVERAAAAAEDADLVMSESALAAAGAWRQQAACRGLRDDLFFPKRNGLVGPYVDDFDRRQLDVRARRRNAAPADLCFQCPVRLECLSDAVHSNVDGVWGGRTRRGRNLIKVKLTERDPDRIRPPCGTLDGGYSHLRHSGGRDCEDCVKAAMDAGCYHATVDKGAFRRSIGDAANQRKAVHRTGPPDRPS